MRVERESRTNGSGPSRIVHSYGHGTGGWTLAFGSALEVGSGLEVLGMFLTVSVLDVGLAKRMEYGFHKQLKI